MMTLEQKVDVSVGDELIMQNDITAIKPELDMLTKIIVDTVPVEQIYLFGSYAYGTPHKDSDFDLYIVLKDETPMRELDAMDAIGLAIDDVKTKATDLLALKLNRFLDRKTGATLERKVAREGVKLYG
jgi:predicted nucleotidyltransferase